MYNNYFISKKGKKKLVFTSLFVACCFSSGVGVLGATFKDFVTDGIEYGTKCLDRDAAPEDKAAAGRKALSSLLKVKSVVSTTVTGVQLTTSRAASIEAIASKRGQLIPEMSVLFIDRGQSQGAPDKVRTSLQIKGAVTSNEELATLGDYQELSPDMRRAIESYKRAIANHNFDGLSGKGLILASLLASSALAYEYYEGKISAKKTVLAIWSVGGATIGGLFFAAIPQIAMFNSRFNRTAETWLKFDSFIGAGSSLSLEFGLNGAILGAAVGVLAYEGYERVYKPNFATSGGYSLTTKIAVATAGVLVVGAAVFYESIIEAFYGEDQDEESFE
jgi:hypothetical protein